MLKFLSILEKMNPDDTNVFPCNIFCKYDNQPDNIHAMCLADVTSGYVTKNADDLPNATLFQYLISIMLSLIEV